MIDPNNYPGPGALNATEGGPVSDCEAGERLLLGAVMFDPDRFGYLFDHIPACGFANPTIEDCWERAAKLQEQGLHPLPSVLAKRPGDYEFLFRLLAPFQPGQPPVDLARPALEAALSVCDGDCARARYGDDDCDDDDGDPLIAALNAAPLASVLITYQQGA